MIELPLPWGDRAIVIRDVDDPESYLRDDELAIARAFPREKRRREWMLARVAAKLLARRRALGDIAVERPLVSVSHSGPWAAAAIDTVPVGIDVEVVRDVSERAARHFLTEGEIAQMESCTIPYRLLHFWCAKEAAWKQRGGTIPFLKQVPLMLIEESERGLRFDAAETFAISGVVVALSTRAHAVRPYR
jgi:phosphopantetheinyl transferase (holo-ACP synthase)